MRDQDLKNTATGALAFKLPERLSWVFGPHSGNDMGTLLGVLKENTMDNVTLSISCMVELKATSLQSAQDE